MIKNLANTQCISDSLKIWAKFYRPQEFDGAENSIGFERLAELKDLTDPIKFCSQISVQNISDQILSETCFTANLISQAGSVDKNTRPEKKKSKSLKKKRPSIFKKKKEKIDE